VLSEDIKEIEFRPNTGLAQIKAQGEVDGADAITKELRQYNLKNVPDMDAYADGFVKGAASKAMFYKDKLDQAIRGGGDEESLMGLVGLKEAKSAADVNQELKAKKAEMVEKAEEYKAAEGKAKEKIKDELKKMTAERDELEKKVNDLKKKEEEKIANKGRDQELDA
jgi:hypothetical protein